MSIEAMKLALEALDMVKANADDWQERTGKQIKGWMQPVNNSITALRQAIEQAQKQEPVAWITQSGKGWLRWHKPEDNNTDSVPLYTSPPQRQPLTDEEFLELLLRKGNAEVVGYCTFVGSSIQTHGKICLLRSAKVIKEFVEAAHGIKGEA